MSQSVKCTAQTEIAFPLNSIILTTFVGMLKTEVIINAKKITVVEQRDETPFKHKRGLINELLIAKNSVIVMMA